MPQKKTCCEECAGLQGLGYKITGRCLCSCHATQKKTWEEKYDLMSETNEFFGLLYDQSVDNVIKSFIRKVEQEAEERGAKRREEEICGIIEDTIQEERFAGAPFALNKVLSIIRKK